MSNHRVELVRHGKTGDFDFWTNESGSLTLTREKGADWQAMIDGDVAGRQMEPFSGGEFMATTYLLTATTADGLANELAIDRCIHVLFAKESLAAVGPEDEAPLA
jgi:hypothetical protein